MRKLFNLMITIGVLFSQMAPSCIMALEQFDSREENSLDREMRNSQVDIETKGNLEIDLKFVLPISNKQATKMNIQLTNSVGETFTINLDEIELSMIHTYSFQQDSIEVLVKQRDKEGKEITNHLLEDSIVYIGTTIYGLSKGVYQVKIMGEGYLSYTTSITIHDYSQRISLSNETGLLEAGDLNNDHVVDENDINLMVQQLGKYQSQYDLNRDGQVDVADLNYITASISGNKKYSSIVNTNALINPNTVTVSGNITGDVNHLFTEVGYIQVAPNTGDISENNPAILTLDMKKAIESSEIRIDAGENIPTDMIVTVITDEGKTIKIPKKFEPIPEDNHTFTDKASENTIVIPLGKQVAVKRVIISITETSSKLLADIAKVDFLNNVYESVPVVEVERPTHVKVTVGSEQAFVTFDQMRNVTGYEILVEELNDSQTVVKSMVYQTTYNEFKIPGLKNYTTYHIRVQSVNQEWKSGYGSVVTAMPLPTRIPPKVNMVVVSPIYAGFNINWKKMDDTLTYNVYYRKKGTSEFSIIKNINTNSYQLRDLEVNQEYEICISGNNELGEGQKSDITSGITVNYTMPNVTNYNLINHSNDTEVTDHIKNVSLVTGQNSSGIFSMVDNRYDTYFEAKTWDLGGYNVGAKGPIIEFDDFYDMDYVLLVPDISSSLFYVRVYYFDESGKSNQASAYLQSLTSQNGQKYYKIGFNQPIKTNKIQICLANYSNSGSIMIREAKFYAHDVLLDEVARLFKDDLRVELQDHVTSEQIQAIEAKVNTIDPISQEYSPNRSVLLSDLEYARKLLNDHNIQDVITIDPKVSTANDSKLGFAMSINDFQPLGVVARPGETLAIYVGNTGKVEPELIFTQHYAEANVWNVTYSKKLSRGQNIVEVPKIGSGIDERGGSIYIRYPGTSSDATIKVRVSGGTKIPILDLHNVVDDTKKQELIGNYLEEITNYVTQLPTMYSDNTTYQKKTSVLNATEIVTTEGLFSIPASVIVDTLSNLEKEAKVVQLLETTKAFDEMVNLFYRHKGLSDEASEPDRTPTSRINIRYMRMFDGAFMYAGGKHIGIEYNSTAGLLTGKTYQNNRFNGYFGWGISHEIGHQINQGKLAYAEVTNNIYALLAQTANDISSSRLESSNIYPKIYEKVTSGTKGKASNVFVNLGMYWQLHLAYDENNTFTDEDSIFAKINQYSRNSKLQGNKDDLLVMYASDAAGENLVPFFEKWGFVISEQAKSYVNERYMEKPSKAIWYLNDEARRYRINGGTGISSATLSAEIASADTQEKHITLSFNIDTEKEKILGYEIKRNGEAIMFTTQNTFTDIIGAMNNRAVVYEITAYDKLLNTTNTVVLDEIKISNDGSIDKTNFTIEGNVGEKVDYENPDKDMETLSIHQLIDGDYQTIFNGKNNDENDAYVIIHLNRNMSLSGIKYKAGMLDGKVNENTIQDYEIYVSRNNENWVLAKKGTFQFTDTKDTELVYFDKEGTTGGDQLWTYNDIAYVKIVSVGNKIGLSGAEIDVIAPPGDNVEMDVNQVGILTEDYCYNVDAGEKECIASGMVIFKGEYRGNPAFNVVMVADANNEYQRYSGESLFFAELNSEGDVYEVANGIWVYAVTKEEYEKMVGKKVRAYLYRVDDALTLEKQRLTSTSLQTERELASYDTLPSLKLDSKGGN